MSSNLGQLPQPSSNHHRRCLGQLAVTVVQYNQLVQVLLRLSRRVGGGVRAEWLFKETALQQQTHNSDPLTGAHLLRSSPGLWAKHLLPSVFVCPSTSSPSPGRTTNDAIVALCFGFFCPWKNSKSCKSADGPSRLCVARLCERWNLVCRWKAPEGCLLVNKRLFTEFFCLCSRILLPSLWLYTRIQSPRTSCWFVPALQ